MNNEWEKLPDNLPEPIDDGECRHLLGMTIPNSVHMARKEGLVDFSKLSGRYLILYFFPMMMTPGKKLPFGWNNIPGARGCTPQNISISEHNEDLQKHKAIPFGISTQSREELMRLTSLRKLSQSLISDNDLYFREKLNLPTFVVENKTMYKRLTLIVKNSKIVKVFYPIFPPDKHVFEILEWLENNPIEN